MNCGSSSVKFAVVETRSGERPLDGHLELSGRSLDQTLGDALAELHAWQAQGGRIEAVGHRVVHGGEEFRESALIDQTVMERIEALSNMAPLHNPAGLLGIQRLHEAFPQLPQVAVFDTAFHQTLPPRAYLYAIPRALHRDHGVRRYGFHGTSHRYVAAEAVRRLGLPPASSRVITAHLGSGCSASAVLAGQSVETSMGLTPLEGLVMGTRSGNVDPGLHAFLADRTGMGLEDFQQMLNRESGLLGLSELSSDVRRLEEAAASGHVQAELALEIFCYRLATQLAGLCVALGGLDALVFTAGIGENSIWVRSRVCELLRHLGLEVDSQRNRIHGARSNGLIGPDKKPFALVIPTDEELLIARDTAERLAKSNHSLHS